jgi:hypothetical protein
LRWCAGGYGQTVTSDLTPDDPIDDQVPVADAVDQRRQVGETRGLSENIEPTEVNEFAAEGAPDDANPADWQEQLTTAADADDWDPENL